jgi:hypothetical protein
MKVSSPEYLPGKVVCFKDVRLNESGNYKKEVVFATVKYVRYRPDSEHYKWIYILDGWTEEFGEGDLFEVPPYTDTVFTIPD